MLAEHYIQIRYLHVTSVVLSGGLFAIRGALRAADLPIAIHRTVRFASYAIDTALLGSAILLAMVLHQYPLLNAWLTAKLLLLVVYIVLGSIAIKRGRTRSIRNCAFVAALAVFGLIVGVAWTHSPYSWFRLL